MYYINSEIFYSEVDEIMEHMSTKQKLKDMNTKQKLEFIWDYYKFHIIGTIVIIAIITSFTVDIMNNKETVLNMTFLGDYMDSDLRETLQNKATSQLVKDNQNKKQILIDFLIKKNDMKDEYSMASVQKLQASIAAKDIDILVLNKSDFQIYANQGTFMKLSQLPNFSQLDIQEKDLLNFQVKDVDSKPEAYGINIENLAILKELKYDPKDKVLGIVVNTKRPDKASEFLKWFFAQNSIK